MFKTFPELSGFQVKAENTSEMRKSFSSCAVETRAACSARKASINSD